MPPVNAVVLHGYGQRGAFMTPLGEALAARGIRAVAPDLRGHGAAPDLAPGAADPQFVADALALADEVGPCVWFGNSLGGRVAALACAARPSIATRLVLGECIAGIERTFAFLRMGMRKQGAKFPETFATIEEAREASVRLLRLSGAALDAFLRWGLTPTPDGRLAHSLRLDVLAPEHWPERPDDEVPSLLRSIAVPVTLAFGADSLVISAENRRGVAACFTAPRIDVIAGAGHDLPLDAPERLAELITSS
jgi:pimeloyl-ACP methyl ester carboxylesterase